MALHKLEALVVVAASTYGWTVDSGTQRYLTAGNYLWSGASGMAAATTLAAHFQTQLRLDVANTTVAISNTTGLMTITWGSGSRSLQWTNTAWRVICGFTGNLAAATSATSPRQCQHLWLPNVQAGALYSSTHGRGRRSSDLKIVRAKSGKVFARGSGNLPTEGQWRFFGLSRAKTWRESESTQYESAEFFWENALALGRPFRFYSDATDATSGFTPIDAVYRDYYANAPEFAPTEVRSNTDVSWTWEFPAYLYVA